MKYCALALLLLAACQFPLPGGEVPDCIQASRVDGSVVLGVCTGSGGGSGTSGAGTGGVAGNFDGGTAGSAGSGGQPVDGGAAGGAPSSGMKIGTNFWYLAPSWSGEKPFVSNVNWATAYNEGANIWNPTWVAELAPYTTLRFMDWGATNWSLVSTWSQRRLPTADNGEAWTDASGGQAGLAYEWMIDLGNRLDKDIWICLPHKSNADYWTQLARLLNTKLEPGRRVYIEYSNETWNGGFGGNNGQFTYVNAQGVAENLPGSNQWYKGGAYTLRQLLAIGKVFDDVFGKNSPRVVKVFAFSGNYDIARSALSSVYKSTTWNPNAVDIQMLANAPYVGSGLDGSSLAIASQFRNSTTARLTGTDSIAALVQMAAQNNVQLVGTYEAGAHLTTNSGAWAQNPAVYDEYRFMLDSFSPHYDLFIHYTHTGSWANNSGHGSWGAKASTGQELSAAHKYRAIVDWVSTQ